MVAAALLAASYAASAHASTARPEQSDQALTALARAVNFAAARAEPYSNRSNTELPSQGSYIVEMTVNEVPLPGYVDVVVLDHNVLAIPADSWDAAGLAPLQPTVVMPSGGKAYALEDVPGLRFSFDVGQLKLLIEAPPSAFTGTAYNAKRRAAKPSRSAPPGIYLDYDLSVISTADGGLSFGGVVEPVAFWGSTSVTAGFVLRDGHQAGGSVSRTETYIEKDLPEQRIAVVAGDTVSSSGGWSRPARFAGIRVSRDFSLDPDFLTYPTPSISGSAALPSTVDILVNGSLQQKAIAVKPGPFAITDLPVMSGQGKINLVTRDIRGVESVISLDHYGSTRLLARGLSDFSFEAGALRRGFGTNDDRYGSAFAAATWRQGLAETMTAGARGELQVDRQALGLELDATIASQFEARASAAYSRNWDQIAGVRTGGRYALSVERSSRNASIFADWSHADRGFEPFAADRKERRPKDQLQTGIALSLSYTRFSARYIEQTSWDGAAYRLMAADFSTRVDDALRISGYVSKIDAPRPGWAAGMRIAVELGSRRRASFALNRGVDGKLSDDISASQSSQGGLGLGWNVRGSTERQTLRGGLVANTGDGQFSADMSLGHGPAAMRLGARGSIGWFGSKTFASRGNGRRGFAEVKVGEIAGVKVLRSNQVVATTDNRGIAVVTGLTPYTENRLSIDAETVPFDAAIGTATVSVVPFARSGVLVEFPVTRSRDASASLLLPGGGTVPLGAKASLNGEMPTLVGNRGQVYLTKLQAQNRLVVKWGVEACQADFPAVTANDGSVTLGTLVCGPHE